MKLAELPIDEDRMYTSGFSGGSRMAFSTSQKHKEIAGVIACGAGGNVASKKQAVYGLCGSNCFNRTDMATAFKGFANKENLLRYFPGQHVWAGDEMCDDAITHLNGAFLIKNAGKYPEAHAHYLHEVMELVKSSRENNPMRAAMWTSFLTEHKIAAPGLDKIHGELIEDPINKLYLEGLTEVSKFAQKTFGDNAASEWKINEKDSAACLREAKKYEGSPWAEVLELMSKDAQKF